MGQILDEIDRRIIALLQDNGRIPNVEIAKELGVAEGTVRRRLERLLSSGIIHIKAVVNPTELGLATPVMIGLTVDLAYVEKVAKRLAAFPEIYSVRIITGNYDMIAEASFSSPDQLFSFLTTNVASIPGVKHVETCHILKVVKWACDSTIPRTLSPHFIP